MTQTRTASYIIIVSNLTETQFANIQAFLAGQVVIWNTANPTAPLTILSGTLIEDSSQVNRASWNITGTGLLEAQHHTIHDTIVGWIASWNTGNPSVPAVFNTSIFTETNT